MLTDGRSFRSNKVDLITREGNYIFFGKKKQGGKYSVMLPVSSLGFQKEIRTQTEQLPPAARGNITLFSLEARGVLPPPEPRSMTSRAFPDSNFYKVTLG